MKGTVTTSLNWSLVIALFIILQVAGVSLHAQPYKNLVFEGAGIRGIAFVGAIKELEEKQLISQVEKVGGTSAGAIAALTVALGYKSSAIEEIIYGTKIQSFNDGKYSVVGGMRRMKKNFGWYRHNDFIKWLEGIIKAKTGNADITFSELHEQRKFSDLYVTGTSLNHQKLIIFSHETYPDMKIKDAVCISMSIPLYFVSVCIDSKGQLVDRKKASGHYDIMADGGFTGNFPIFMFDSIVTTAHETSRMFNPNTLGLRIDTPEQITYDLEQRGLAPVDISRFRDYVGAFYIYVIENLNRTSLTPADWKRTVSISSGAIGPKIRKLSHEEKNMLISNGQQAMKLFLK